MSRATADPTIPAGDLDKRVMLLEPIYNAAGDEIVQYQTAASVWAGVDPAMAVETDQSGRTVEGVMVNIFIRYRSDIDARWRIQDHEHTYEIKGIWDIARRRVQLQLSCQEVL